MKKYSLSLILVLCLFVITGGVYSAWTYYTAAAAGTSDNNTMSLETVTEVSKGNITVTNNNLTIKLDQADANYAIKFVGTGSLTIGLSTAGVEQGTSSAPTLNSTLYYKVEVVEATTTEKLITSNATTWQTLTTTTLNGSDIAAHLSTTTTLPTKAAYDTFAGKLSNYTLKITVSETNA